MPQRVADFFDVIAAALVSGDLEETISLHRFPYPCHIEDRQLVMWTEDDLRAFLLERRASILGQGVTRVAAHVAGIEVPRDGRFRVWVRWTYHAPVSAIEDGSASIFYLQRSENGRIQAEMCHFLSLSALRKRALLLADG